ncbi:GIY-YIG nuclease family protein [Desulfosarcina sp.]|uniref:GIY-YIG nuclease family protein n=1 Tax=Desulfosarcina sp. TaxID=2027861 RepID=UPI0029B55889|nr:GIY-YIG nuclease family protein [Desulfosarcina sp.]MDX2451820.1 GIY-YIG nuclease family protein [Desulfosarcina sp.]MDX2489604.1 GIY-YIG nuclease family protein [Desulfosarcina sp.]
MTDKQYYVYILASKRNGTLYTGITSDLIKRTWQHKNGLVDGFSKRYGIKIFSLFRSTQQCRRSHPEGKAHQKMEPRMEDQTD